MAAVHLDDLSRLATPAGRLGVVEQAGVLRAAGPLVVAPVAWPEQVDAIARHLRQVPAVTVLITDPAEVPTYALPIVDAFDVCLSVRTDPPSPWVHDAAGLLEAAVAERPLGAHGLVALTRVSARLSPEEAIWAESTSFSTLMGSRDYQRWLASRPPAVPRPEPREVVLVERHGDVLSVTLNRPHVRNALDMRLRDALVEALEYAEVTPELRVELRGEGASFSAGGDLSEFGAVEDPATAHAVRATRHPALALSRVADRTTVWAHGPCVGAGVELAAFASRVIATPDATFRLPEVAMGLIPGAGGTCSLVRRLGRQRANWLMLTGASLDAGAAFAWGLVDEVADDRP